MNRVDNDCYAADAREFLEKVCETLDRGHAASTSLEFPVFPHFIQGAAPLAIGISLAACNATQGAVYAGPAPHNTSPDPVVAPGGDLNTNETPGKQQPNTIPEPNQPPQPAPTTNNAPPEPSSTASAKSPRSSGPFRPESFDCRNPKYAGSSMCQGTLYGGPPPLPSPDPRRKDDGKDNGKDNDDTNGPEFGPPNVALYAAPPPTK